MSCLHAYSWDVLSTYDFVLDNRRCAAWPRRRGQNFRHSWRLWTVTSIDLWPTTNFLVSVSDNNG